MARLHLGLIAAWALGTAAILSAIEPRSLDATPAPLPIRTDQGSLAIDGAQLRFSLVPSEDAGRTPSIQVQAENPSERSTKASWTMSMLVSPPVSPMSRVGPMSKETWKEEGSLQLEGGQKRSLQYTPDKPLEKGSSVQFILRPSGGKDAIVLRPQPK